MEGAVDVCAFLPYSGTTEDNFSSLESVAEKVAKYTGGEALCYKGEEATVDFLAKAVESCAMVMIGSHGNSGAFGIITNEGITQDDKDSGHYADWGAHYYYNSKNEKTFDYNLWMIDGTIIANHMTKDAPGNFVYSSSCMSMKTDRLCAPLREKGVSAVFGWSESVTSEGDCLDLSILTDLLCSRKTLADAFVEMKKTVGCEWDPTWTDYTYYKARNSAAAFPIIVSEVDEYPGEGNVNDIQTVNSIWKLPVRSDVPEKQVISLGSQYMGYVVAETRHKITNVTIAAGGLPKGMSMSYEDNRVVLSGKPTTKGYSVATYKITTEKNETITKPVGILTADYTNMTNYSKTVEYMAPTYKKYSGAAFLDASDSKEAGFVLDIPLEFESSSGTFAAMKYSGCLPFSLEFGFDDLVKGSGYIRSQHSRVFSEARDDQYKEYYHATAPGQYDVTIDFVTKAGDVIRYRVKITIKENNIYTETKKELTYYINDDVGLNIRDWKAGAVTSVHILEGELPPGIILANSWDKPFGFYGTAATAGDYTVKFRIANYADYYDHTYTFHIKPALLKIKGNAKNVGDTVELEINRDEIPFENYTITWEVSQDKKVWASVETNEPEGKYTLLSGYAKWYVRAAVNEIINGKNIRYRHFSDIRYINPLPELTGTVFYTSGIASNMKITTARGGLINDLYNKTPEKLHYQWQKMESTNPDWTDIDGAIGLNFTPNDEMIGTQIRVKATYDGYTGAVYSTPREIHKRVNNDTPITPSVYTGAPYTHVTVMNAKADQEYVVMYSTGSPDWTDARRTLADGKIMLECEKDRTAYIYTRKRETNTSQAGMRTAHRVTYNGHTEYLQGLTFDKTSITTKVGDVTQLTVSPLPEDFGNWNDSYTLSWFVNGSEVELYEDEECTLPVAQHSMISTKTVYVKGKTATSNVSVGVEKTVGYNDLKIAYCSVEVADEDGDFILQTLNFDEAVVRPGEISSANYTTYPSPAKVGLLSFDKNSGPDSEIIVLKSGKNDGTVNIVVPDDALPGVYYYGAKVDNSNTPVLSAIKITVRPDKFNVLLDPNNVSGNTIVKTVNSGAEYILPGCPDEFEAPENMDFDGWDKGAVGSKITINEDLTLTARWKPHEHILAHDEREEPICTRPGMEEHYHCIVCGKLFEDADGSSEVPTEDHFEMPPKGHTPGEPVREKIINADCTHNGSYEEAVYCKECETELSRETKTLPAKHSIVFVPEKAATCTEIGLGSYYRCEVCDKCFSDENGEHEIEDIDYTEATGHDWGDPEYTWAHDDSTVTAKRVCKNDHAHVETETVKTTINRSEGQTIFTAEFDDPAFQIQKKIVDIETKPDTDSNTDSGTDTETNSDTNSDTDSGTDTETNSNTNSDTDSGTDSETNSDTNSDTDSDTDSKTDHDTDSDTNDPNQSGLYGDLDNDGEITANDALILLRASVGMETLTREQNALADVDDDGDITSNDALVVLRNSVGMPDNNLVGKPFAL